MLHNCATSLCLGISLGSCDKHEVQIQTPGGGAVWVHSAVPRPLRSLCARWLQAVNSQANKGTQSRLQNIPVLQPPQPEGGCLPGWRAVVLKGLSGPAAQAAPGKPIASKLEGPIPDLLNEKLREGPSRC